jgi:hypothetical protein
MLFNSFIFVFCLAIVLPAYYPVPRRFKNLVPRARAAEPGAKPAGLR